MKLARQRCEGLPVTIRMKDYRNISGTFDRIVSAGMFEHVGAGRYRAYMRMVRRCLAPEGLFLLQSIAGNRSVRSCDPRISRYVFPKSMLPSSRQISTAAENLLVLEDWHHFGPDDDPTLLACAVFFRTRRSHLWQIFFSRNGVRPNYERVR